MIVKEIIEKYLKKNIDYGYIDGIRKPCLFKSGAEKLVKLCDYNMSLKSISTELKEHAQGICSHRFLAIITIMDKDKNIIAESAGYASTLESCFESKKNREDALNPACKMAQKRAFVGAVLIATATSEFFTTDFEREPKASQQELALLFKTIKEAKWSTTTAKEFIQKTFGVTTSKELSSEDIRKACVLIKTRTD